MIIAFLKKKSGQENGQGAEKNFITSSNMSKQKKKLLVIAIILIVVVAVVLLIRMIGGNKTNADIAYTTASVERRDITDALTGSGTLEASDSYSVSTLKEGEVLAANFEEGDIVEKDSVLYVIDSSDVANSIEKAQISLEQSQRSYQTKLKNKEDLTIAAPVSGSIFTLNVKVGDQVTAGQTVATIRNSKVMSLTVSFPADDAAGFFVGQNATVTLDGSFETLSATISEISGTNTVLIGNMIVKNVKLDVTNPGGISTTQAATASVNGIGSSGNGTFTYKEEKTVTAKVSGDVSQINVAEGNWVNKDKTIMQLTSDTVDDNVNSAAEAVRTAQLSLDSQKDQLDAYTITSPISGTIVDKNYKVGDTVESGKILCTTYDMSYLTMTLDVDELDIADVSVEQKVTITADAVEGRTFEGVVTKVSVAGTTTSGVTTYPVTIRIDKTEGLMPGMSCEAEIVISQASAALAVPSEALARDKKVLLTTGSPSAKNALPDKAPEGYVYVSVTTGVTDNDFVEICSGISEGDVVAYIKAQTASSSDFGFGPGGGAGPGGAGGAPTGGPGGAGGAPTGGPSGKNTSGAGAPQ